MNDLSYNHHCVGELQRNYIFCATFKPLYLVNPNILLTHTHTHTHTQALLA